MARFSGVTAQGRGRSKTGRRGDVRPGGVRTQRYGESVRDMRGVRTDVLEEEREALSAAFGRAGPGRCGDPVGRSGSSAGAAAPDARRLAVRGGVVRGDAGSGRAGGRAVRRGGRLRRSGCGTAGCSGTWIRWWNGGAAGSRRMGRFGRTRSGRRSARGGAGGEQEFRGAAAGGVRFARPERCGRAERAGGEGCRPGSVRRGGTTRWSARMRIRACSRRRRACSTAGTIRRARRMRSVPRGGCWTGRCTGCVRGTRCCV